MVEVTPALPWVIDDQQGQVVLRDAITRAELLQGILEFLIELPGIEEYQVGDIVDASGRTFVDYNSTHMLEIKDIPASGSYSTMTVEIINQCHLIAVNKMAYWGGTLENSLIFLDQNRQGIDIGDIGYVWGSVYVNGQRKPCLFGYNNGVLGGMLTQNSGLTQDFSGLLALSTEIEILPVPVGQEEKVIPIAGLSYFSSAVYYKIDYATKAIAEKYMLVLKDISGGLKQLGSSSPAYLRET